MNKITLNCFFLFLLLQLWDLSQRCEAREHSHQSEIHHYDKFAFQKPNSVNLALSHIHLTLFCTPCSKMF